MILSGCRFVLKMNAAGFPQSHRSGAMTTGLHAGCVPTMLHDIVGAALHVVEHGYVAVD